MIARAEQIQKGQIDLDTPPLTRWFGDSPPSDQAARADVSRWLAAVDPPGGYATAYSAFARGGDATYADRITDISCPLWAITGGDGGDPNSTPPAMSQAIAKTAPPRGRALVIEGHRHMVNLTAPPDAVSDALTDWLACDPEGATT